jgi:hypothetical protein
MSCEEHTHRSRKPPTLASSIVTPPHDLEVTIGSQSTADDSSGGWLVVNFISPHYLCTRHYFLTCTPAFGDSSSDTFIGSHIKVSLGIIGKGVLRESSLRLVRFRDCEYGISTIFELAGQRLTTADCTPSMEYFSYLIGEFWTNLKVCKISMATALICYPFLLLLLY